MLAWSRPNAALSTTYPERTRAGSLGMVDGAQRGPLGACPRHWRAERVPLLSSSIPAMVDPLARITTPR
jgi:hypothetical protein